MHSTRALVICLTLLCAASVTRADSIESLSGNVIEGKVLSRDDKFVVMEVKVAGKPVQRKYGISLIRAITIDGQREVLKDGGAPSKTPGTPGIPGTPGTTTKPGPGSAATGAGFSRTRAEVEAIINAAGKDTPAFIMEVQLNLPQSLDLTWPEKPEGNWNNQRNVGQYIWDIIHPNTGRWPEGIRLMLHLMEMHKGDARIEERCKSTMASMYHKLFQDYARAAYWWRQTPQHQDVVALAECYYKLGNKQMAVEILDRLRSVPVSAIKLWADMGETDKALKLVELFNGGNGIDDAYIYAGDACRQAGRYKQAISYYEKILAMKDDNNIKRNKTRAGACLEAIKLFDTLDLKRVADGTYTSSALGYETQVKVEVVVTSGRIDAVRVTEHHEKQYYASITDTCAQIVAKQTVKGIDATSRATITSEAIINATAKALNSGIK